MYVEWNGFISTTRYSIWKNLIWLLGIVDQTWRQGLEEQVIQSRSRSNIEPSGQILVVVCVGVGQVPHTSPAVIFPPVWWGSVHTAGLAVVHQRGGEYQVCMIVKLYWNLVEKLSQKRIWSTAVVQWSPCPFWAKNSVRESYSKFLVRFSHKVRRNYWTLIGRKSDNLCPKFETYFVSTNIPLPKTWWEKGVPPPESFSDCGFPNTG